MSIPLAGLHDDEHYGPAPRPRPFERGTDGPRVIMVGVDGSDTSLRAAAAACGMARRQGCELTVVFVAARSGLSGLVPEAAAAQLEAYAQVADELRESLRQTAVEFGIPITLITRNGTPLAELRQVADRIKADWVFVGASMQAGHRLAGSVAVRLVRLGRWPVAVVP